MVALRGPPQTARSPTSRITRLETLAYETDSHNRSIRMERRMTIEALAKETLVESR
jgi:hypothetical protein